MHPDPLFEHARLRIREDRNCAARRRMVAPNRTRVRAAAAGLAAGVRDSGTPTTLEPTVAHHRHA